MYSPGEFAANRRTVDFASSRFSAAAFHTYVPSSVLMKMSKGASMAGVPCLSGDSVPYSTYFEAAHLAFCGIDTQRISDLRESFVEVLVVPRVKVWFAARSNSNGSVSVILNFVHPIRALGQARNHGAFHWLGELGFSFRKKHQPCCASSAHD